MANEMDSILWVKELVYETQVLSHEYVRKLCKIMHDCGMDETMKQEWVSEFKERITGWYERLILDAEDAKNEVVHTIEELLRKAEGLCRQLQIQMPCYGSKKLSLFEERRYLLSTIAKYEEKIQSRKKEISDMITREKVACRCLGVEPKPLPDDPLPSQADLLNFEARIAMLEDKKHKREEHFLKLKGDIIDVVEKLKIKPSLELEKIVVSPNNSLFMVTDGNMEWVESYYLSLIAEYEKRELVKLLEKREQLLSQIHELNEKPATKERLKNRGGQLLREEMERKTLSKTLSQMETNLLKLADEFELRTGSKFRSSGETIREIIKNSNMDKEMKKQQKLNARNEVKKALSPGRTGLCLASIYNSQPNLAVLTPLRKTPGTKSAKHTPLATSKRKLVTQLSSGGKRTKNNIRAIGVSPIAPQ